MSKPRSSRRVLTRVGLATTAAGTLVGGLAALAGASTAPRANASAPTLTIMGFGTNGDDVAMSRYKIAEKAVAPDKVIAPNGGFSDETFLTDLASGNAPDLIYMSNADIGTYAAKGALEPLTSCISSDHIDMGQFTPGARAEVTLDGTVYGIPEFTDDTTVIVDDAVLQQAGVSPSSLSTTNWTNLLALAKKLVRFSGGKLSRIGFDPKAESLFPLWAKADGGAILSTNGLKAELNSKADIQALTFDVALVDAQGGGNEFYAFRNTWNFFGNTNEFAENQVGAFPMQNWYYNVLASTSPNVAVTAVPFTTKKGTPIDYVTGSAWVIPKASKNKAAACEWAKTMTATSTWIAAAKNRIKLYTKEHYIFTGLQTGNHVADAAIVKLYNAYAKNLSTNPFGQSVIESYKVEPYSFTIPNSPASEAVNTAWTTSVTAALNGTMTPTAALDQAQSQAQTAINQAVAAEKR
jgi:multiple sugar transport system substrate-binding protein